MGFNPECRSFYFVLVTEKHSVYSIILYKNCRMLFFFFEVNLGQNEFKAYEHRKLLGPNSTIPREITFEH